MASRRAKSQKKKTYSKEEIQAFLNTEDLAYQKIKLPYGLSTPGIDRSKETSYMFKHVKGKSVLDLGSYLGAYCFDAKRNGASKVVGLEINDHRVRQARKLNEFLGFDVEFRVTDMDRKLPFEHFDYILNLNVLHRLDFPFKLFHQMMRMANDRIIMEYAGFNAEEAKLVGYGRNFRKVRNEPVMWVAEGNSYVPGDRSKRWFIGPRAIKNYFLYQHHYIGKLEVMKHGFKDRHVIVAHKRRYDKLVVIAGSTCGDYKKFLKELRAGKHASLAREMGLQHIEKYPVITPKDIPTFDTVEAEGVVLLYDLVKPMIGEVCVEYRQDRVFELFECAKKVVVLRLDETAPELLEKMKGPKKKAKPSALVRFYFNLPGVLKKPVLGFARFFKSRGLFSGVFSNLKKSTTLKRAKEFYKDPSGLKKLHAKWDKFMKEHKHVKAKVVSLK